MFLLAAACLCTPSVGRAEEIDFDALWKLACQWEVGSAVPSVRESRAALIKAGAASLDYLIPAKLDTQDGLVVRAFEEVITSVRGDAKERLLPCLDSDKPNVRRNAASLLGQLGATDAAPRIATLLKDKDARGGALAALGALKVASSVPAIVDLLDASDSPERLAVACITTLGSIGGGDSQSALLRTLSSKKTALRFAAQFALEQMRSVGALTALLADPSLQVRLHAINALGHIADRASRLDLIPLLDDPSPQVRAFTVEALAAMPKPSDLRVFRGKCDRETELLPRGKLEEAIDQLESLYGRTHGRPR